MIKVDLSKQKFKCSHCGAEYPFNSLAIKWQKNLNEDLYYQLCPKDGSPAFVMKEETESAIGKTAIVGKAIVGKAE